LNVRELRLTHDARDRAHELAGKWDDRGGALQPPFRCRWFFSWSELDEGLIAGFFAGYEGGGAFVDERFHARFQRGKLREFVWNKRDHLTGDDRSGEEIPDHISHCHEEHAEVFLHWHDRDPWESGFLCLAPGLEKGLTMLPSSLMLEPRRPAAAMNKIAAMVRCTGILCSF